MQTHEFTMDGVKLRVRSVNDRDVVERILKGRYKDRKRSNDDAACLKGGMRSNYWSSIEVIARSPSGRE